MLMRAVLSDLRPMPMGRVLKPRDRVALLATLALGLAALVVGAALPAASGAYATPVQSSYSSAPGLPDGRVYEEVSPSNKYSSNAGALHLHKNEEYPEGHDYFWGESVASADGNGMFFGGTGPMGESVSGLDSFFVAQRTSTGWSTRSALPRALGLEGEGGPGGLLDPVQYAPPQWVDPAADLSSVAFSSTSPYAPSPYGIKDTAEFGYVYLAGSDPLAAPLWLTRPGGGAVFRGRSSADETILDGGTPDLSTVYFTSSNTYGLPEDASRNQLVEANHLENAPFGFYQYRNGALSVAGVLPDGSVSAYGAVPAAMAGGFESIGRNDVSGHFRYLNVDWRNNEVSSDGSRAFFVSPDPLYSLQTPARFQEECQNACTAAAPELYVRETAPDGTQSTVLVSQSQLPGQVGQPESSGVPRFLYASSDGSHVFFASADRLTEAAPNDESLKVYDFDVNTDTLTYLPGVVGPIVAVASDGSSFFFENTATSPTELDRWIAGLGGGSITPVAQGQFRSPVGYEARLSADGTALVFEGSGVAGFNDGRSEEVFRYDTKSNELSCVSCPPMGVSPSGSAVMSNLATYETSETAGIAEARNGVVDDRVISSDGSRVFFESPDPLVPQDTDGKRDVYEWENGTVFLISSGASTDDSLILDNSESGDDVFFATADALVPGDTEGGYDVYDARVPHPGDNPPPAAVPCQGEVCQGPPSVPSLLGAPASATFNGVGNIVPPEPTAEPVVKPKSKPVKCKRGYVKKRSRCVKKPNAKKRDHRRGR